MKNAQELISTWSGLPECSLVVFRHLQKTGGSSIVRAFHELERDMLWTIYGYWSPCWQGRSQLVARGRMRWLRIVRMLGERANSSAAGTRMPQSWLRELESMPWPTRMLFHLHHPDSMVCGGLESVQAELAKLRPVLPALGCRVTVAMVVREPWSFFVSWYYYIGAARCGWCTFERFVALNPNAQSHLTLGGAPRIYSDKLRAQHARRDPVLLARVHTIVAGIDVIGVTEKLDEFMLELCDAAGLRVCPRLSVRNVRSPGAALGALREVALRANASVLDVRPDESSGSLHRRAVALAGWLDEALYSLASTRARRRGQPDRARLEAWRMQPMFESSGCFGFAPVTAPAHSARKTKPSIASSARSILGSTRSEAMTSAFPVAPRDGAGGRKESQGVFAVPFEHTSSRQRAFALELMQNLSVVPMAEREQVTRELLRFQAEHACKCSPRRPPSPPQVKRELREQLRCADVRAALAGMGARATRDLPAVLRPWLLPERAQPLQQGHGGELAGSGDWREIVQHQGELVAMCCTKVHYAHAPRLDKASCST